MTVNEAYALRPGIDLVRHLDEVCEVVCVCKSSVDVQPIDRDGNPKGEVVSMQFSALTLEL